MTIHSLNAAQADALAAMMKQSRFDKASRLPAAIRRALMLRCYVAEHVGAFQNATTPRRSHREKQMTAITDTDTGPGQLIRWRYFGYAVVALGVMTVAIASHDHWFLNFVHVICGVLWDRHRPVHGLRDRPDPAQSRPVRAPEIIVRLVPRTLFLMPTLSIITGTTGWFLAKDLGLLDVPWPQFGWVAAALALVVLMTIQGTGYLLPTNLWVCVQLRRPDPDVAKINRVMANFFFVVGLQGVMQVLTIVIMARFVTGL